MMQGSDGAPSASDLREMKYLELCLKETLRLFPPIPMIIRELKEDAVISKFYEKRESERAIDIASNSITVIRNLL